MRKMDLKKMVMCGVAPVLIGMCWAGVQGSVAAEYDTASWREACTVHGGLFEQTWAYNDQGMKWGEILSCSVDAGTITCRSGICRIGRGSRPGDVMATTDGRVGFGVEKQFPAETQAFSAALLRLSEMQSPMTRREPKGPGSNEIFK